MGSFAFVKYLRPLFGHQLPRRSVPAALRRKDHPNVQLYCTSKEKRRPEAQSRKSSQREEPAFPKSVFAAGTAKRTADFLKRRAGTGTDPEQAGGLSRDRASFRGEIPERPLSAPEWRKLKESSSSPERFEVRMMALMLAAEADVNIAKSLLAYVAMEKGEVPYMLLLRYLALCVSGGHHSEVLDTYDVMRSCFKALDSGAYSLLIKGFGQTERWREALVMLEEMKKVIMPSPRNYGDAIAGAFLHGDGETGWMLYGELLELRLTPNQDTWQCLFENASTEHQQRHRLADVLTYMRENQVYPEEPLARSIKAWFESLPDEKWRGRFSSVDSSGRCRGCRAELESIELTEEEYAQLRHRVMTHVIEGRDVFNKTTPEELESFKSFVKKSPAFDVIVDGLNVASVSPKGPKSQTLLAVVSELRDQGLNVLVLGRKHMLRPSWNWDRHDIHQIRQRSLCFFTENISEDDPFLLYAALHSGNHCNFVSRDLMRDHKACLPDGATRRLFFKWQRGHQLVVQGYVPGKKVRFQRALRCDTVIQSTGAAWHVPYDEDGAERSTYEVPQRWLCLTKEQQ
ncbi:mitochondrial ribonuclease P catalytic subunit isoform X2 [Pygocentrus nattereri]|uniref:Mitochondrial ribonuclease P catalytic subunit n=1 Tax=Pygocentrus nattereri TaxID=42514 RepID=A0A3B4E3M1_PYGNA|nr:mitochondrial ribonuclease P catalytic subunit isoform X2 [Pygocentrus nattereri]